MFWIVFFSIVLAIITITLLARDSNHHGAADYIVLTLLSVILGGLLGVCVGGITALAQDKEYKYEKTLGLVAMSDTNGVDGSFFLLGGQINDVYEYIYFYETNIGVATGTAEANTSYIKEEKRDDGKVDIYNKMLVAPSIFALYLVSGQQYVFTIPEGSLKRTFSINDGGVK
jgi:hypothetical protein